MNKISDLITCPHWTSSIEKHGLNIPIDPNVPLICITCREEARSWTRKPSKKIQKYHRVLCQDCHKLIWRVKTSKDGVCGGCNRRRRIVSPKRFYKGLCKNNCGGKRIEGSMFCSDRCRHEEHKKAEEYYKTRGY